MDIKSLLFREITTERYRFHLRDYDAENVVFYGETKKFYGNKGGYCNNNLVLTREFIENEEALVITDALASLMDGLLADAIEHAIAMGDLKKSDIIEGRERKE